MGVRMSGRQDVSRKAAAFALMVAALGVAGCGDTKLLSRTLPDETRVIDGPSLAVPPDYELRPPRDAADYETSLGEQKAAEVRSLITGVSGSTVLSSGDVSGSQAAPAADSWLLEKTGTQADPNVRKQLEQDSAVPEDTKKKGLFKRWFGKNNSGE